MVAEDYADRAVRIAEATETAYMADVFGDNHRRLIALYLLAQDHTDHEAEAILKSKHLRWSDDSQGTGIGKTPNSASFKRYYERLAAVHAERGNPTFWQTEAAYLASETPSDLAEEAS